VFRDMFNSLAGWWGSSTASLVLVSGKPSECRAYGTDRRVVPAVAAAHHPGEEFPLAPGIRSARSTGQDPRCERMHGGFGAPSIRTSATVWLEGFSIADERNWSFAAVLLGILSKTGCRRVLRPEEPPFQPARVSTGRRKATASAREDFCCRLTAGSAGRLPA